MQDLKEELPSYESLWKDIQKVRKQKPLVHNITNYVAMNFTANALLAFGASPVMAHALEEVEDFASIADSLLVNIGTLSPSWVEAMTLAMAAARRKNTPMVLDPVGCGATAYRTETSKKFLALQPTVVRGNVSEISALSGGDANTRGVDAATRFELSIDLEKDFALAQTVVASGAQDLVVGRMGGVRIDNGVPMMTQVTAMGCASSALIAAFCGVNENPFFASAHAMGLMGVCGELAYEKSQSPGSFAMHFIDSLHAITEDDIASRLKVLRA